MKLLSDYRQVIDESLPAILTQLGPPSPLRDVCDYALSTGGKRFRPTLVLMIADAQGKGMDATFAAAAIEAFHTASLIADDLPCMDNDDKRRDHPSVHIKYDESTALLASYALIAAGYELLALNARSLNDPERGLIAVQITSQNTGLRGACMGQYDDLSPSEVTQEVILDVIKKKTVTLFEIAFCYGWIFGGGELSDLPLVKKAAEHFGMAFQIADDLGDTSQDVINGRSINLANFLGKDQALQLFHVELQKLEECLKQLKCSSLLRLFDHMRTNDL